MFRLVPYLCKCKKKEDAPEEDDDKEKEGDLRETLREIDEFQVNPGNF